MIYKKKKKKIENKTTVVFIFSLIMGYRNALFEYTSNLKLEWIKDYIADVKIILEAQHE